MQRNPCLACGACCAFFRASFYWAETEAGIPGGVPEHLTRQLNPHRVVMRGTEGTAPRCVALDGMIGHSVCCTIHPRRASVCRDFDASYFDGKTPNERCDRARAAHGLLPLTPDDWVSPDDDERPAAA